MRTSSLLSAVESKIAVNPGALDVLLSVLAKQPSMGDLHRRMKDTYSKSVRQASLNGSKISGCKPHMIVLMMCLVDQHRLKEHDLNISLVSHPSVYMPPTIRNYALGIVLVPKASCLHSAPSANWELYFLHIKH